MKAERAVFDTNVLISALLSRDGSCRRALDVMRHQGFLIFSDETFAELVSRLNRPKFDRYVRADLKRQYLTALIGMSEWVTLSGSPMGCRDVEDDKFLEAAVIADATVLVSGDQDLLVLGRIREIPIVNAADFLLLTT